MRKVISIAFIAFSLLLTSCKRTLAPQAYMHYVQDEQNGLKKKIKIDGWEYTMTYRPYDYIICQEGIRDTAEQRKRMSMLQGTAWFNISFRNVAANTSPLRYGISSLQDYNERMDFFLNHMATHISLIYGKDTLGVMSYLFETNYNLTPQETIVVGFSLPKDMDKPTEDMELIYQDVVFKNGIIKTRYTAASLKDIPNIIY